MSLVEAAGKAEQDAFSHIPIMYTELTISPLISRVLKNSRYSF